MGNLSGTIRSSLVATGAALAVGGMVVVPGVLTSSAAPAPVAASTGRSPAGLVPFRSCAGMRGWYAGAASRDAGQPGGTDGRPLIRPLAADAAAGAPVASPPREDPLARAVGSSATGTTTQEPGVDEPDVAKTDGRVLVVVVDGSVRISDVTGDQPRRLASYRLPRGMSGAELLLADGRVVVAGSSWDRHGMSPMDGGALSRVLTAGTRVLTLGLADPSRPRLVGDETFSGALVSARQYGDTVRVVTSARRMSALEDAPRSSPEGLLPTVRDSARPGSAARPLLGCHDVLHPVEPSGAGTVSVIGFDVRRPGSLSAVAVAATAGTVYSSSGALYLASTVTPVLPAGPAGPPSPPSVVGGGIVPPGPGIGVLPRRWETDGGVTAGPAVPWPVTRTVIDQFDLAGRTASYVASGSVRGIVRDRWSMDEHDGHLRLATQTGEDTVDGANAILTLTRRGHRLVETGRLGGLGKGEEIRSVRWFADLAVLVTFRRVDPLLTIDLGDPSHPRLAGVLRTPGFSGYLHPVGHDLLLGLGAGAGPGGRPGVAQISLFDLSDLRHPVLTGRHRFGPGTALGSADDPRGFTWLPAEATGVTALEDPSAPSGVRLVRITATSGGRLTVTTEPLAAVATAAPLRVLPLPDGRLLLVTGATARTTTS